MTGYVAGACVPVLAPYCRKSVDELHGLSLPSPEGAGSLLQAATANEKILRAMERKGTEQRFPVASLPCETKI